MSYKEIQRRKNLTSRVLQLQVDRFVSNKTNKILMPSRPIRSMVNKNGFIEVLNGAIESHDYETLESIIPKDVDLSIRQNGGFSIFFWLYSRKVKKINEKNFPKDRVFYIFKKGGTVDQFTPSVGLIVELIDSQNPGAGQKAGSGTRADCRHRWYGRPSRRDKQRQHQKRTQKARHHSSPEPHRPMQWQQERNPKNLRRQRHFQLLHFDDFEQHRGY